MVANNSKSELHSNAHCLSQIFLSFCFIASFAFVLQRCKQRRHRAKPITLRLYVPNGSPFGRAPAIAGERVLCAQLSPLRRLRRHRLAAARSRSGSDTTPWCHSFPSRRFATQRARLLVSPIITQIGRENKFSAEIFVFVISPLRMQRENTGFWFFLGSFLKKKRKTS